jgi:hypothetical protein
MIYAIGVPTFILFVIGWFFILESPTYLLFMAKDYKRF